MLNYSQTTIAVVLVFLSTSCRGQLSATPDAESRGERTERHELVELSSREQGALLLKAKDLSVVIMNGSRAAIHEVVAARYEHGLNDPYVSGLVFGPSERADKLGFREILLRMQDVDVAIGQVWRHTRGSKTAIKARVFYFDRKVISLNAALSDRDCNLHGKQYLTQQFAFVDGRWEVTGTLFESETDGPC